MGKQIKLKGCLRSDFTLLPIGTRIHYHHRAGIARWLLLNGKPSDYPRDAELKWGWKIVEGTLVYNNRNPELVPSGEIGYWDGLNHNTVREMFFDWKQAQGRYYKYNKTVMVWPEDNFGWIMGIMKKSIGFSTKSRGYHEDYEQGYHESDMYVDLYVVKPWYEGTQYILCPLWAVQEVTEDEAS